MDILIITLLIIAGVVFMLLELFLIPGFGISGLASIATLAGAVYWTFLKFGVLIGNIILVGVLLLLALSIYIFLRGKAIEKMSLETSIPDKIDLVKDLNVNVGDIVRTTSRLAPMGKVLVNGQEVEAKCNGFIEQEVSVEIVKIEGNILIVKAAE